MNRFRLLAAAIAMTIAGAALAAPQAPSADATHRRPMMKLDTNHDGVIDRPEAAAQPRLAEKFDTLDRNRNGRLEAGERPSWKGKRGKRHGMREVIALDSNGDGRVSRVEAAGQPRFAERFDQADTNRDGYLVRSELQASAERRHGERMAEHRARFEAKFSQADRNHDGKLSRAEVETGMPHLAKTFAFLDEDRDGYLTRTDLQHTPRR